MCCAVCLFVLMFLGSTDLALAPLFPLFLSSSAPSRSLPCYSLRAAEGRQWSLHALDCLLHCLNCFCVPVSHSLPIFVFINHNGRLLWVSWWLFWGGEAVGWVVGCCLLFHGTSFYLLAPTPSFKPLSLYTHAHVGVNTLIMKKTDRNKTLLISFFMKMYPLVVFFFF